MAASPLPATAPAPSPANAPKAVEQVPSRLKRAWSKYGTPLIVGLLAIAVVVTITRNWNAWEGARIDQVTNDAYVRGDLTQLSANPYVVALGKPETASSRLDLTQAFDSLGTTIAPKLGGLLILAAAPCAVDEMKALSSTALHLFRVQEAASVKMPDTVIGIALVLLAVLIATSKLPTIPHAECRPEGKGGDSVWKHPNLAFGALAIFAYVGAEVSIGSFLVNYFGQPEIAGLSAKTAAGYVLFYWAGAMIGRFLGAGLLRKFRAGHLLGAFAICTSSLVSLSMLTHGHFAMWSILAVGFFNSIMFPTIFSPGVAELDPLTGNGSGILNTAIVGGAILPLIQGAIADHIGIHHAFFVPVICYLYILYYALSGSKPNSERYATP
jgi:FHS family L-fucose permease-like MFS transporter